MAHRSEIQTSATATMSSGDRMHALISRLFPIHRSLTGPGVRETLGILAEEIPLKIVEVPTGSTILDWTVPKEWRLRHAQIKDDPGKVLVDSSACNLHVVGYSKAVQANLPWSELRSHLFSLPGHPNWIPYRTSYFGDDWGFCLSHRQLEDLDARGPEAVYEVSIEAELVDGSLTYGELVLPGRSRQEVLISTHVCHPSLANDNLSGIAVATQLAQKIQGWPDRLYTYRFVFVPATIGAIAWLARNESVTPDIRHGLVLTGLGDPGAPTYKRSRRGNAVIDRAVQHLLSRREDPSLIRDFVPFGYDERQYCSPGFDLPVGCLSRSPHGEYPEYHTSGDNLDFVRPAALEDSYTLCLSILDLLEDNRTYLNLRPKGEPQLGKHGLYEAFGRGTSSERVLLQQAVQWVLSFSDGTHSLLDITEKAKMDFEMVRRAAHALETTGLVREMTPDSENDQ